LEFFTRQSELDTMKRDSTGRGRAIMQAAVNRLLEVEPALSRREMALVARLDRDAEVHGAFSRMVDHACADALLNTILQAAELQARFPTIIKDAKRLLGSASTLGELERHEKAINGLEIFLQRLQTSKVGRVQAQQIEDAGTLVAIRKGHRSLRSIIKTQRRIAEETIGRLGATRSSSAKNAANLAALGWLADGIRRLTGKPNRSLVAGLSQAVLQVAMTEDQVRVAERVRVHGWRVPRAEH